MKDKQKPFTGIKRASILKSEKPGWVCVVTPFIEDFVDELKERIAPSHRLWDPDKKWWLVNENYLEELIEIVQSHFDEVSSDLVESTTQPMAGGPYATMFLLPGAPQELVKSAYRLLSFAWHPDKGGTTEQMSKLNLAYETIRKERGMP